MATKNSIARQQTLPSSNLTISPRQRSWWNSLSEGQRKFIVSLSIFLGVSIISLIAYYFIKKQVQEYQSNKAENQSFGADKYATWAKEFKQAFDNDGWWGTDVPLVRRTMKAIPSQEDFTKVQEAYRKLYKGANLVEDLTDELTRLEFEEMLAIKNGKPSKETAGKKTKIYDPKGWAKRIHSAVNYSWVGFLPGTDEDAIREVFAEFPTQKAFYETAYYYKKFYHISLWTDLDGDLDYSLDWRALLKKKPKK